MKNETEKKLVTILTIILIPILYFIYGNIVMFTFNFLFNTKIKIIIVIGILLISDGIELLLKKIFIKK